MKHTPGPWRVDETKAIGPMGIYSETARQPVSGICWFVYCRNYGMFPDTEEMPRDEIEANARLIAAAPELLAALKQSLLAMAEMDDDTPLQREVGALIAKVEGR